MFYSRQGDWFSIRKDRELTKLFWAHMAYERSTMNLIYFIVGSSLDSGLASNNVPNLYGRVHSNFQTSSLQGLWKSEILISEAFLV
jgi:hypothetical protein